MSRKRKVKCPDCGNTDPSKHNLRKNPGGHVYPQTRCRPCHSRESLRHRVERKYGVSYDEYLEALEQPCAICGAPSEVFDHCHETGKGRAALCQNCNKGLGFFKDCTKKLTSAIDYLKFHQ